MITKIWIVGVALMGSLSGSLIAEGWTQFRGPTGDGHVASTRLPLRWSEDENVKWKVAIHGRAWSSPVVSGGKVWLTTATEDGTELSVLRVDSESGAIAFDRKMFFVEEPQFAHKFNSYASPTPVIEGDRVYVTFGSAGTACLDADTGRTWWARRDLPCDHWRGAGSSPILWKNLFILHYDGADHQYVVALDKETGRTVWRTERSVDFKDLDSSGQIMMEGDFRKGYSTPTIIDLAGRPALLSLGSRAIYLYDPATGREFWHVTNYNCHSGTCRPLYHRGVAYVAWGFPRGELSALKVAEGGRASLPRESWKLARNVPSKPSPVIVGDLLFMVDDGGVGTCLDVDTGAEIWRRRIQGNHSASPIVSGDRVYFFNEEGETLVLLASREFTALARNQLDSGFMASPAVEGDALILRTKTHLYRIEE